MGWTSRADVDRYFALADPTFDELAVLRRLRLAFRELAHLVLDQTPQNAAQSVSIRTLREAEWAAQAAIMHHRGRAADEMAR